MLTTLISGFTIGIIGSLHCIGMCGPLALAVPLAGASPWQQRGYALLYNVGRAFTYATMGVAVGGLGRQLAIFGWQQYLSIIAGIFLLLMWGLLPVIQQRSQAYRRFTQWIQRQLRTLLQSSRKAPVTYLSMGLLNGLLPCGLVYVAIGAAMATGSSLQGGLLMLMFGLGTIPSLLTLMLAGNWVSIPVRQRINKWLPYTTILVGILLIVRGLNLGIPYISPAFDKQEQCVKSCCHKKN